VEKLVAVVSPQWVTPAIDRDRFPADIDRREWPKKDFEAIAGLIRFVGEPLTIRRNLSEPFVCLAPEEPLDPRGPRQRDEAEVSEVLVDEQLCSVGRERVGHLVAGSGEFESLRSRAVGRLGIDI